jgi:hypothetical protein
LQGAFLPFIGSSPFGAATFANSKEGNVMNIARGTRLIGAGRTGLTLYFSAVFASAALQSLSWFVTFWPICKELIEGRS